MATAHGGNAFVAPEDADSGSDHSSRSTTVVGSHDGDDPVGGEITVDLTGGTGSGLSSPSSFSNVPRFSPRAYQLEMFGESLKGNIIVAVGYSCRRVNGQMASLMIT